MNAFGPTATYPSMRALGGAFVAQAPDAGRSVRAINVPSSVGRPGQELVYDGEHGLWRYDGAEPPQTRVYLRDAMGSVIGLMDEQGSLVESFEYDAFGNVRGGGGEALVANLGGDSRFQGMWKDAGTGLYYVRARYYDSRTGRFLSRDPAGGVVVSPETFLPYAFASNNPHAYVDPTGLFTIGELEFGFLARRALVSASLNSIASGFLASLRCDSSSEKILAAAAGGAVAGFVAGGVSIGALAKTAEVAALLSNAFVGGVSGVLGQQVSSRVAGSEAQSSFAQNFGFAILGGAAGKLVSAALLRNLRFEAQVYITRGGQALAWEKDAFEQLILDLTSDFAAFSGASAVNAGIRLGLEESTTPGEQFEPSCE